MAKPQTFADVDRVCVFFKVDCRAVLYFGEQKSKFNLPNSSSGQYMSKCK